jgi:catechol 1,2-dioxygenase
MSTDTSTAKAIIEEGSMRHDQIDELVKSFIVDTATGEFDSRLQQAVLRLTSDLFNAIEDLDLTPTEVWKGHRVFRGSRCCA